VAKISKRLEMAAGMHSELGVRAGINVLTVVGSPPVRLSALAFVFSSQHALPVADRLMRDLKET